MNSLKEKIKSAYPYLTHTNKLISDTILNYPHTRFDLTIAVLAKKSYCSSSAIVKYVHYFGYDSYKVFLADLNLADEEKFHNFIQSFQLVEIYLEHHAHQIKELIENIKTSNKIYLFAAGQSQIPAIDFRLKSNKLEFGKFIFEPNIATQELLASTISSEDFVIFISNSGEARELVKFYSNLTDCKKILITNRQESKLSKLVKNVICFQNTIESPATFKEYTRESKYTLLYFFDKLFELLYYDRLLVKK